jgi:flagellar basal-body rod protein FlgB
MVDIFSDRASSVLTKVMDGTGTRQRALANNIANAEKPGYQRQEVDFTSQLREIITSGADEETAINRIDELAVDMQNDATAPRKADGNSVQVEREMVELAKNTLQYETSTQLLEMKFRILNDAIRGSSR